MYRGFEVLFGRTWFGHFAINCSHTIYSNKWNYRNRYCSLKPNSRLTNKRQSTLIIFLNIFSSRKSFLESLFSTKIPFYIYLFVYTMYVSTELLFHCESRVNRTSAIFSIGTSDNLAVQFLIHTKSYFTWV